MKAGVAAMVAAAEAAAAAGTAGDIVLALVADEEHASVGTEAALTCLAGRLPDACLVGEPTWLDLAVAHRGYAVVQVVFTGQAAHSSQAALGVNAVSHLGRLISAVEERDALLAARPGHPVAGTGSMMTTVAGGGTSPFVLADAAFAVVERRTVPGEASAGALAEVQAILAGLQAGDPAVQADASMVLSREAWEFDPAAAAAAALSGLLAEALAARAGPRARAGRGAVLDGVSAVAGRRGADRGVRAGRRRDARRGRVGRPGAGTRLRRRAGGRDRRLLRSGGGLIRAAGRRRSSRSPWPFRGVARVPGQCRMMGTTRSLPSRNPASGGPPIRRLPVMGGVQNAGRAGE